MLTEYGGNVKFMKFAYVCRNKKKKTKNCWVQLKQTQNPAFCFMFSCSKNPSPKDGAATPGTPKVR